MVALIIELRFPPYFFVQLIANGELLSYQGLYKLALPEEKEGIASVTQLQPQHGTGYDIRILKKNRLSQCKGLRC